MTEKIKIKVEPTGMGAFTHNLLCWFCQKNSAVYNAYPDRCFLPCWKCQKKYTGIWTKKNIWDTLKPYLK